MPAVKFSRELPEQPEREFDLLDTLKSLVDPRPAVSDAYWSATHPIDRIMGRGRAAGGGMMEFPWGAKFPPKSFPVGPPEKGLTAVRLPVSKNVKRTASTEDTLTWRGTLMDTKYNSTERGMPRETWERHHLEQRALGGTERGRYGTVDAEGNPRGQATGRPKPRTVRELQREEKGSPVSYNIIDKDGKLVGSSHMRFFPDKTEVDEVFLKKELRASGAKGGLDIRIFKDMVGAAIDRDVPIKAVAGNPKIARLLNRLAKSQKKVGNAPVRSDWDPRGIDLPSDRREILDREPERVFWDGPDIPAADPRAWEREQRLRSKPITERAAARTTGSMIQRSLARERLDRIRAATIHDRPEPGIRPSPVSPAARARAVSPAESDRLARIARARAQLLAQQRRAPNPMRVSRPGRGGV